MVALDRDVICDCAPWVASCNGVRGRGTCMESERARACLEKRRLVDVSAKSDLSDR